MKTATVNSTIFVAGAFTILAIAVGSQSPLNAAGPSSVNTPHLEVQPISQKSGADLDAGHVPYVTEIAESRRLARAQFGHPAMR